MCSQLPAVNVPSLSSCVLFHILRGGCPTPLAVDVFTLFFSRVGCVVALWCLQMAGLWVALGLRMALLCVAVALQP